MGRLRHAGAHGARLQCRRHRPHGESDHPQQYRARDHFDRRGADARGRGNPQKALFAAAISFAQIGAYGYIHGAIEGLKGATLVAVKVGLHAVVGGAVSMVQGGSFGTGALTGAVSAAASLATDNSGYFGHSGDKDPVGIAERTAIAAVAGGTASVLSGGKFANGAITGAFEQLYNGENGNGDPSQMIGNPFSKWSDILLGIQETGNTVGHAVAKVEMGVSGLDGVEECISAGCSSGGWVLAMAGIAPGGEVQTVKWARSAAARSKFLRELVDDFRTPSWMKQWLGCGLINSEP